MKKVMTSLFTLIAVMTLATLTGCSSNGIEGTWKADQSALAALFGEDIKQAKNADMTIVIGPANLDMVVEMEMAQEGMEIGIKIEAKTTYTKTDTELNITPQDAKAEITKLVIPENMKALLEASGMTEEKMKEEMAKEFGQGFKSKEAMKSAYTLEGDKLTIKDLDKKGSTIVLTRQ